MNDFFVPAFWVALGVIAAVGLSLIVVGALSWLQASRDRWAVYVLSTMKVLRRRALGR